MTQCDVYNILWISRQIVTERPGESPFVRYLSLAPSFSLFLVHDGCATVAADIVKYCTKAARPIVVNVDTTFYLTNAFVTPILLRDPRLTSRNPRYACTRDLGNVGRLPLNPSPTIPIGFWLHTLRDELSYDDCVTQLLRAHGSLKKAIKRGYDAFAICDRDDGLGNALAAAGFKIRNCWNHLRQNVIR